MSDSYFHRRHLVDFPTVARGNKELAAKFFDYYAAVFAQGALSVREKSLIALGVAHVVQCPYCIDAYTGGSLEAGADLEQMTETVHAATVARGRATVDYGVQMAGLAAKAQMSTNPGAKVSDAYFSRKHLQGRDAIAEPSPALAERLQEYEDEVLAEGACSRREKLLVALAVSHTIQNPYGIDRFTHGFLEQGGTVEEMTEAIHVACAIRGGAALVHAVQMLEHFDQKALATCAAV